MNNKKQLMILREIVKQLKEMPAHDMSIAAAIYLVGVAIQNLEQNNHKPKITKGTT